MVFNTDRHTAKSIRKKQSTADGEMQTGFLAKIT
jgi:hypothetical protein